MKIATSRGRWVWLPSKKKLRIGIPSWSADTRGYTASVTIPFMHVKGEMSMTPSHPWW